MNKQKLLGLLIALLLVGIFAFGMALLLNQTETRAPRPTPMPNDRPLARVDEQFIGVNFWAEQYLLDQVMSRIAGQPMPAPRETLERLINEMLLLQAYPPAEQPTPEEAEAQLAALLAAWDVDELTLLIHFERAGLTRADVIRSLQRLLLVGRAQMLLLAETADPVAWVNTARAATIIYIDESLFAALTPPIAPTPVGLP